MIRKRDGDDDEVFIEVGNGDVVAWIQVQSTLAIMIRLSSRGGGSDRYKQVIGLKKRLHGQASPLFNRHEKAQIIRVMVGFTKYNQLRGGGGMVPAVSMPPSSKKKIRGGGGVAAQVLNQLK